MHQAYSRERERRTNYVNVATNLSTKKVIKWYIRVKHIMSISKTIKAISTSFTVAGNIGISPFLTLFLLGIIERYDETLLNMNSGMENLLSSVTGLGFLGLLTIGEFIGKCIPIVDEMIDSVEIFIVPALSVLGSLATMGLLEIAWLESDEGPNEDDDLFALLGAVGNMTGTADTDGEGGDGRMLFVSTMLRGTAESAKRYLQDATGTQSSEDTTGEQIADTALTALKVVVIIIGIVLALCVHLFKMIVRLFGEGCCTGCITIVEVTFVVLCLTVAIFIEQVSIIIAVIIVCVAIYIIKKNCFDKPGITGNTQHTQQPPPAQQQGTVTNGAGAGGGTAVATTTPPTAVATVIGTADTTATDTKKPAGDVVETSAIATATPAAGEHPQPSAPTAAELIPAKTE